MKYLTTYELFNAQDIMSMPTSISKLSVQPEIHADGIPTNITDNFKNKLMPYYMYIKTLKGVTDLTPITYEHMDNYFGFSFTANYNEIFILTDKKDVFILINEQLIPIASPKEIIKIIESESI
jgi:hypothetical protein